MLLCISYTKKYIWRQIHIRAKCTTRAEQPFLYAIFRLLLNQHPTCLLMSSQMSVISITQPSQDPLT